MSARNEQAKGERRVAYKIREVAEMVGVSRQKVYDWITDGHLRGRGP